MKLTSKTLAKVCVAILVLYMGSAALLGPYLTSNDHYGVLAALFAANAGTAFLVWNVFSFPKYSDHTSGTQKLVVLIIAVVSGLFSAVYWMADEIDNIWLRVGIVLPVLVILLVLVWFVDKVGKEETKHKGR